MRNMPFARYWVLSILLTMAAIGSIGFKWYQIEHRPGPDTNIVHNASELEQVLASADTIEFSSGKKPYRIPTGFFIQSLAFTSASDVNVTGYIWQKYPENFPADIEKGFVFPEEVASEKTTMRKIYTSSITEDGKHYDLLGWYFDVTMRQSFDYTSYPLDQLTVWLRLWPKDFSNDDRLILVPDFTAYTADRGRVFGLDREIVQGEWEIDSTFFSYQSIPYDTDFGYAQSPKERVYKEFFINVGLQRKFINAFIINLIPLLVVALLLFAQMMTVSGDREKAARFGFTATGAVATCSALFFVVLLAHVQVRSRFVGSGLVYLEYFYLLMYAPILLTSLNAYLFSLNRFPRLLRFITFEDNLIPKLTYWPVLLWAMAIVTWVKL